MTMTPDTDMIEGTEAFTRFQKAMKAIVAVKKSAVLPPKKKQAKKKSAKEG